MKELRDNIIVIIEKNWPVSVTEIAFHLGLFRKGMNEKKRKAAIGKVIYHIKKLKEINKINTKKIGQTVIIWPTEIEKLRVMNELMK
jgi:predicted transcriptional regulator